MEQSIRQQLWQTAAGVLTGCALGLLFDLGTPLRRSWAGRRLSEALFLLLALPLLFGVRQGVGADMPFYLVCVLGGAALYSVTIHNRIQAFLDTMSNRLAALLRPLARVGNNLKKALKTNKKHYAKGKNCYTILNRWQRRKGPTATVRARREGDRT